MRHYENVLDVYFDDLDAFQILHNARYLLLFERTIGAFWKHLGWGGVLDAQEIFGNLRGALHTAPVKVGFAAYYDSLGRVDLTENHADEAPYSISGTKLREQLVSGERPDNRIIRGEVADILIEAYRTKGA